MDDSPPDSPSEQDLVIGTTASRVLVTIKPDGRLIYGPEYTPDEAARIFWETLARKRAEAERAETHRIRLATPEEALLGMEQRFNEWEPALIAVGVADAANEIAQTQRNMLIGEVGDNSPEMLRAQSKAAMAEERLNECAVALVKLGRAHALRKGRLQEVETLPAREPLPDSELKKLN